MTLHFCSICGSAKPRYKVENDGRIAGRSALAGTRVNAGDLVCVHCVATVKVNDENGEPVRVTNV